MSIWDGLWCRGSWKAVALTRRLTRVVPFRALKQLKFEASRKGRSSALPPRLVETLRRGRPVRIGRTELREGISPCPVAPLDAARTARRAVPTAKAGTVLVSDCALAGKRYHET